MIKTEYNLPMWEDKETPLQPLSQDSIIDNSSVYDGLVDPQYYHDHALDYGGEEMTELLAHVIEKHVPIDRTSTIPARILDVATGTGMVASKLAKRGYQVVGADLSRDLLTFLHEQHPDIPVVQLEMNFGFPFADESFDGVTTQWANRFIFKQKGFTSEVYRVLKPGGAFVWPIYRKESMLFTDLFEDTTLYQSRPGLLKSDLESAGFKAKIVTQPVPNIYMKTRYPLSQFPTSYVVGIK